MSKEIEEKIYFIDEFLSNQENYCDGEEGKNCSLSRKKLSEIKHEIEQLEKEFHECKEWTQTVVDRFNVANEENTKLKERVKELEVNSTLTVLQGYYSKIELNKLDIYDILDLIEKDMNYLNQINKQ